jgi:hypothetical protein
VRALKSPSRAHADPRRYSLHIETSLQRLKWLFGLGFLSPIDHRAQNICLVLWPYRLVGIP